LSPAEHPQAQPPDEPSVSPPNCRAEKWTLSREALDKVLTQLSPDREEAGRRYLVLRLRITRFFEWQRCSSPDRQVDITLDRVAKRIDEGQEIDNLTAYSIKTAGFVYHEWLRERDLHQSDFETFPDLPVEPADEQKEVRLRCLDDCLGKLTLESRNLILGYYANQGRAKIDDRLKIAEALEIPLNALRIRACRIRKKLEKCLTNCLEGNENGSGSL
jgi:DNA-directed RNA polymerase specialized sigma24 family protein